MQRATPKKEAKKKMRKTRAKGKVLEPVEEVKAQTSPVAVDPDPDAPIRWRKAAGSGTFRLPGKIVKPGQVFTARRSEVPKAFRDSIKALDPMLEKEEKPVVSATDYRMDFWSEDGDVALYNVVQAASGKAMNESPLPKADAEKLLKDLS